MLRGYWIWRFVTLATGYKESIDRAEAAVSCNARGATGKN